MTVAEQAPPSDLDDRYGRSTGNRRRNRVLFVGSIIAFVVVLGAWLLWAGLLGTGAQIDTKDTGHQVIDDHTVSVSFALTVNQDTATRCAVEALNQSYSVVGWKIIDVPASSARTRDITETVRTSELAVTGLIYRCWLA